MAESEFFPVIPQIVRFGVEVRPVIKMPTEFHMFSFLWTPEVTVASGPYSLRQMEMLFSLTRLSTP